MDITINFVPEKKEEAYEMIRAQLQSLLEGEEDLIANMANMSALLAEGLKDWNWIGFYRMKNGELILGPFQGKVACMHIAVGRGVCGTAVKEDRTQLVPNVHEFPGHIACDSASNSEIVIPVHKNGEVIAVLDMDSPLLNRFTKEDQEGLEACVRILEKTIQ